jgi:hypothetical protein
MNGKRYRPEQIIQKLRQAEIKNSKGATVPQAASRIGVTEQVPRIPRESLHEHPGGRMSFWTRRPHSEV